MRAALVQTYRDNAEVPAEVGVRVAELQTRLEIVEIERDYVVQAELERAREGHITARINAEIAAVRADATKQLEAIKKQMEVLAAGADAETAKVRIESKLHTARIDRSMLRRQKRVEAINKAFESSRQMRSSIWRGAIKPAIRILVPLIIIANLVADDPSRSATPVLGQVNAIWDAIYVPIREGIIRVINDFRTR